MGLRALQIGHCRCGCGVVLCYPAICLRGRSPGRGSLSWGTWSRGRIVSTDSRHRVEDRLHCRLWHSSCRWRRLCGRHRLRYRRCRRRCGRCCCLCDRCHLDLCRSRHRLGFLGCHEVLSQPKISSLIVLAGRLRLPGLSCWVHLFKDTHTQPLPLAQCFGGIASVAITICRLAKDFTWSSRGSHLCNYPSGNICCHLHGRLLRRLRKRRAHRLSWLAVLHMRPTRVRAAHV
mmetsp:Transcript_34917/g.110951  ORF Transcript_34917/g.110951 Transcript_34917/m.110951 type:complete len:232 (-) Transcript_34917:40-735(-)